MAEKSSSTSATSAPRTSNAEEMTTEVVRASNRRNELGRLVHDAADLTKAELLERAAALSVDTSGSPTKAELEQRVRDARA
jgi:predicted transcriptional regulator